MVVVVSVTDDGQGTSGPSCDVPDVGHKKPSGTKRRKKRRKKGEKAEKCGESQKMKNPSKKKGKGRKFVFALLLNVSAIK